jgi:hypothetical protein
MSVSREMTIHCDECGDWHQDTAVTATQLRKRLKKRGWWHRGRRDLCNVCADAARVRRGEGR